MKYQVLETAELASRAVANEIIKQVVARPNSLLGLATGSTPLGVYKILVEQSQLGLVDFSSVQVCLLDEYVGLSADSEQSYRHFINANFTDLVGLPNHAVHGLNGEAADLNAECDRYEELIATLGGVDFQLLGLGENGHIAFNEPGTAAQSRTHQQLLAPKTRSANSRFFDSLDEVPTHALTQGIATIAKAKKIVLLALGESKAEAVADAVSADISEQVPASLLRDHRDFLIVADRLAGAGLS